MTKPIFTRIAIIGLGLIGSSIARGARERNLAKIIAGCDANDISLAHARKGGFIDIATQNPAEAAAGSELVILATPPSTLAAIAESIAPHLQQGVIVMDVCSVKQSAIAAIAPHIPKGVDFMPAHPIAGSEQSGVGAGRGDLFEKKRVIVTPDELQDQALQTITTFWQNLGARVEGMPAHLHDMIYAHVSHLPQLLAFAAAPLLADYPNASDATLQKFLRLSGSNPAMWADLFLLNKENLLKALDRYLDALMHIGKELAKAPEANASGNNEQLARTLLFPRIAASCLITTIMESEKRAGFSFGRYAGTGFADFTAPASSEPEGDIERISGEYQSVAAVLGEYTERLKNIRAALAEGDRSGVENKLIIQ